MVHLGYSDDEGSNWKWRNFGLKGQSSSKPVLALKGDELLLGFDGVDSRDTVGTYYIMSYDNGRSFLEPKPITSVRWNLSSVKVVSNGVGLRKTADFGPDGIVRFAYGDARRGNGKVNIFVAAIEP